MNHPEEGSLNDHVDGRLDRRAADQVEGHLEECGACRERVAAIRELNARLASLPRGIAPRRDLREGIHRRVGEAASPARVGRKTAAGGAGRGGWLRAAVVAFALAGAGTVLWLGLDRGIPPAGAATPVISSYVSAAAELVRTVEDRKSALGPAGARALTESLASIDAAIHELERARRRSGTDAELLRQLEARHRAKLELLRGAVTLLEES